VLVEAFQHIQHGVLENQHHTYVTCTKFDVLCLCCCVVTVRTSLDPANFTCDSCPQYAVCQGGAQIVPDVGYWSSSRMSPQIHP
jgi:hypothetical protein